MEQDVTDRFVAVDARITTIEGKVSNMDAATLAHYAEDAKMAVNVADLAKKIDALTSDQKLQLEILKRLDQVAANPNVKVILAILATVLASWAASKGFK